VAFVSKLIIKYLGKLNEPRKNSLEKHDTHITQYFLTRQLAEHEI